MTMLVETLTAVAASVAIIAGIYRALKWRSDQKRMKANQACVIELLTRKARQEHGATEAGSLLTADVAAHCKIELAEVLTAIRGNSDISEFPDTATGSSRLRYVGALD